MRRIKAFRIEEIGLCGSLSCMFAAFCPKDHSSLTKAHSASLHPTPRPIGLSFVARSVHLRVQVALHQQRGQNRPPGPKLAQVRKVVRVQYEYAVQSTFFEAQAGKALSGGDEGQQNRTSTKPRKRGKAYFSSRPNSRNTLYIPGSYKARSTGPTLMAEWRRSPDV